MNTTQHVLSTSDIADLLAVPARTVRHWLATGRLDGFRLTSGWRTTPEALRSFIEREAHTTAPNDIESSDQ